jgi:hypothetical protein
MGMRNVTACGLLMAIGTAVATLGSGTAQAW